MVYLSLFVINTDDFTRCSRLLLLNTVLQNFTIHEREESRITFMSKNIDVIIIIKISLVFSKISLKCLVLLAKLELI
jgi:hypothetical protein